MRLLGQNLDDRIYLMETNAAADPPLGIVFDARLGEVVGIELPVDSILARGYWVEFAGSPEERAEIEASAG